MAGKEKPQILDLRRSKMLAAMGVQVWHLRPAAGSATDALADASSTAVTKTPPRMAVAPESASVPEVHPPQREPESPAQPPEVSVAAPPPVPLEFLWAKSSTSMLLFSGAANATNMTQVKDMLRYADWRTQVSAPSAIKSGEFKWPQLLDTTTGTPIRALRVFIEKHFPDESPWFLVADDLVDDLLPWLRECLSGSTAEKTLVLQSFNESLSDAALKKQIWQILKQIR